MEYLHSSILAYWVNYKFCKLAKLQHSSMSFHLQCKYGNWIKQVHTCIPNMRSLKYYGHLANFPIFSRTLLHTLCVIISFTSVDIFQFKALFPSHRISMIWSFDQSGELIKYMCKQWQGQEWCSSITPCLIGSNNTTILFKCIMTFTYLLLAV